MNRKIDIFTKRKGRILGTENVWVYECSTNGYKTCKEAKKRFCTIHYLDASQVKCNFAKVV